MPTYIETLESRTFLSTSPDPAVLAADQQRVTADVRQIATHAQECGRVLSESLGAVAADLQRLAATPRGKELLDNFEAHVRHYAALLGDNFASVVTSGLPAGAAILDDIGQLFIHRDNPEQVRTHRATLAAHFRQLRKDTAAPVAVLRRNLLSAGRALSKDLRAIARFVDDDPAVRLHRQAVATELSDCSRTLRADFKVLAKDVQTMLRHSR